MIDTAFAEHFAHEWVEVWNSHDLEAVFFFDESGKVVKEEAHYC